MSNLDILSAKKSNKMAFEQAYKTCSLWLLFGTTSVITSSVFLLSLIISLVANRLEFVKILAIIHCMYNLYMAITSIRMMQDTVKIEKNYNHKIDENYVVIFVVLSIIVCSAEFFGCIISLILT